MDLMNEQLYELVYLTIFLLIIVFWVGIFAQIFNKAGYSGWWGITAIFFPILFILLIFLAAREWPVQREARMLRLSCGIGTESDGYSLIKEAGVFSREGKNKEALVRYELAQKSLKIAK